MKGHLQKKKSREEKRYCQREEEKTDSKGVPSVIHQDRSLAVFTSKSPAGMKEKQGKGRRNIQSTRKEIKHREEESCEFSGSNFKKCNCKKKRKVSLRKIKEKEGEDSKQHQQ